MQAVGNSTDLLVHYFIKELEHTWRVKFPECQDAGFKKGVDQITVVVDLKGVKLKDLGNKQLVGVFKQLTLEVQRFFPCLLHKLYVLNSPLFFENIWEGELQSVVDQDTIKKIVFSPTDSHEELLEEVDHYELPRLYGGLCECRATCVYSEKGPWSEVENFINYKDPNSRRFLDSDEDDCSNVQERADLAKGVISGAGLFGKLN